MPQTTITSIPAVAKEGLLYDAQGSPDGIISGVVEEATGIKPGRLVIRAAGGDFSGKLPAAAGSFGTNVLGVSAFSHKARSTLTSSDNEVYDDKTTIPLVRQRRMWVLVEDAFTPDSAVFVRVAAGGGGTEIGGFRTDADTATAVAWTGARFVTSGGAGELGVLEINI